MAKHTHGTECLDSSGEVVCGQGSAAKPYSHWLVKYTKPGEGAARNFASTSTVVCARSREAAKAAVGPTRPGMKVSAAATTDPVLFLHPCYCDSREDRESRGRIDVIGYVLAFLRIHLGEAFTPAAIAQKLSDVSLRDVTAACQELATRKDERGRTIVFDMDGRYGVPDRS